VVSTQNAESVGKNIRTIKSLFKGGILVIPVTEAAACCPNPTPVCLEGRYNMLK
jgi:hypothetical protein